MKGVGVLRCVEFCEKLANPLRNNTVNIVLRKVTQALFTFRLPVWFSCTRLNVTFLCSMDCASYNMAIIIEQDATEYSLFKSINCSTCLGWYFTHHQQLITLYLQYLALQRPLLLPVVNVAGRELARCVTQRLAQTVWNKISSRNRHDSLWSSRRGS